MIIICNITDETIAIIYNNNLLSFGYHDINFTQRFTKYMLMLDYIKKLSVELKMPLILKSSGIKDFFSFINYNIIDIYNTLKHKDKVWAIQNLQSNIKINAELAKIIMNDVDYMLKKVI